MKNKKKRATETMLNPSHHSDAPVNSVNSDMVMAETSNQLNHPIEVKEEPGIKAESQSIGELVDISAPINCHLVVQPNDGYDYESLDFDDVKIEAKEEIDEKKKEGLKANTDSGEDATGNQQQQTQRDEDDFLVSESSHGAKNTKACNKVGNPKNASKKCHCAICEFSTDHKGNFNQHLLKHTVEKPHGCNHGCNVCPKRFTQKKYLRTHMKVHVEEFLFHCMSCLQGFDVAYEKNKNETICKFRRYECHLCKESFGSQKSNMMSHMRIHSGDKPFECKECFKQFKQKAHLNRHMKLHASPRPFRCSKCNTRFCHMRIHQNVHLKVHMKLHTKELSSKCLICRKGFLKDGKRKTHQRNCNGRYYECFLCKKFFNADNVWLKGHMHTHSGEKPFQCQLCRNTFTRKENLNRHMKNIHQK